MTFFLVKSVREVIDRFRGRLMKEVMFFRGFRSFNNMIGNRSWERKVFLAFLHIQITHKCLNVAVGEDGHGDRLPHRLDVVPVGESSQGSLLVPVHRGLPS